ncbi:putative pentatricopeptide repeat-containing protein at3g16890 mitochondrial [Phtheirospermum japonicum]|uniref:Putative pentatricopeptide repeat-containing protein at3g16890 mitochondrial n=1 Tax=Phtheirospermum japonicum TaxID=374723 RepID=A0A830CX67_9LAMI|nr:putative pentatricopeptide repeat-containing protein at3g16890 mitochondrial [Phtheirospermum japonicum]
MRKLSSLASRVAPEIQNLADNFNSHKKPQIPKPSIAKHRDQKIPNKNSSTGKLEFKNSDSGSISIPKAHISADEQRFSSKPIDRHYFAEILSRKDWYLILNHEFKARSVNLNTQVAVSIFQNQGNALSSLRFYVWLSSFNSSLAKNKSIHSALSNALYRKGPILLSPDLIHEIKNSGCRLNEDLLCALIGSWGRLGLAKYCSDVFEQVSYLGIVPSTRLYNAVIDGLVKSNSLDLAYLKFHQMEVDNCKRDRFTYNILIHGVCKAGVVDEALRLVKQMESLGYSPNVFTYTILIDGYFNSKKIDEAFSVLERMKTRNVRPNDATYRTIINGAFCNLPPFEAFELLLSRWVNNDLNLPKVVYDSIVYCLCENSLPKQVVTFFRISDERGYVPDSSISNIVITCLVKGLLDLDEICRVFDFFIERGVKVDLRTCLAHVENLYKSRRDEMGNRYLSWIIEEGLVTNVFSYNMVIDCYCKAKMMDKAIETFRAMSKMGIFPNLVTFNTLIAGYCKGRDVTKAREMLIMLLDCGFKPDVFTFSSIIDVLCQSNRIIDAFDCFFEMVEWGINPNAITYNSLIRSLCVSGNIFKAMKLLRKMQVDGIKPDVYTFNALIQNYCKFNKIEKAQRLLMSMLSLDLRPDNFTYVAFINCLCESGRFVEAKNLFNSMEENGCGPDAYTCDSFVDALVKLGRFRDAKDVWLKYKEKGVTLKPMAVS